MSTHQFRTTPFPYQLEEFEARKDVKSWGLFWDQGCVDAKTEYLSPSGWRRMDRYPGGPVAQWDPETGCASFEEPLEYVKLPCDRMIYFDSRQYNQMLSPEHRVLYQNQPGEPLLVGSAEEMATREKPFHMPLTFKMPLKSLPVDVLEENTLRIQTLCVMKGRRSPKGKVFSIKLKTKEHFDRLLWLIQNSSWGARFQAQHERTKSGLYKFTLVPLFEHFDSSWYTKISEEGRRIIVDEMCKWVPSPKIMIASLCKEDLDFFQFLFATSGVPSTLLKRPIGWALEWTHGRRRGRARHNNKHTFHDVQPEGNMKYCFRVKTEFLVFRRRGKVFVSGNTGKSKLNIDRLAYLYKKGAVNAMLLVAPNGVHRNWIEEEFPKHLPEDILRNTKMHYYESIKSKTKWHLSACNQLLAHDGLSVLAMSYNGFMTKEGKKFAKKFLLKRKCFYALDEAHHIKEPGAKRTISIVASGRYAEYKQICTGTPVAEGPFGVYAPIKFLNEQFWYDHHLGSYPAFKQFFGTWRTAEQVKAEDGYDPGYDLLLGYKNLEILKEILAKISSRVVKEDVLQQLPPKLYTKLYFDMNPEQEKAYKELSEEFATELASGTILESGLAIVRMLRLQQITCGYAQTSAEEPSELIGPNNPRLDAAVAWAEGLNHQAIIWARFKNDIRQLMDALGNKACQYDGQISDEDCARSKEAFQKGDKQFFVANQAKGKEGLTLTCAKDTLYYSNNFKLIDRQQTEDRNHRIGSDHFYRSGSKDDNSVLYTDLICSGTIDTQIVRALRNKYDIATQITGEKLREWI